MNMHSCVNVPFNSNNVLSEDDIRRAAPSVFAVTAHSSRSAKFEPIPTIELIRALRKEGFEVVGARQARCKTADKADYTKHVLRLRQMNDIHNLRVGDTVAEALLCNANDGTASYRILAELFRVACLNGMCVALKMLDDVIVRHTGKNVQHDVIEGTFSVVKQSQLALAAPREWSQIQLDSDERKILAESAHQLRFADDEGKVTSPVTPDQLLVPRRSDDRAHDLWTVTNVIQEHVIRGGDVAYGRDANNNLRRVTSRPINGIDGDIKLNRALFALADKMAVLKGAKALTA